MPSKLYIGIYDNEHDASLKAVELKNQGFGVTGPSTADQGALDHSDGNGGKATQYFQPVWMVFGTIAAASAVSPKPSSTTERPKAAAAKPKAAPGGSRKPKPKGGG